MRRNKTRWRARAGAFLQRPDVILFAIVGATLFVGALWALSFRPEAPERAPVAIAENADGDGELFEKRSSQLVKPLFTAPAAPAPQRRLPRLTTILPTIRKALEPASKAQLRSIVAKNVPRPRPAPAADPRAPKRLEGTFSLAEVSFTAR